MVGIGLIATLTALVLGLLVSSAKSSFDTMNAEIMQSGTKLIMLDRTLLHYGPETKNIRDLLRRSLLHSINLVWPEDKKVSSGLSEFEKGTGLEQVGDMLRSLSLKNDPQRLLQAQALQVTGDLQQARWLMIEQAQSSLPTPFLVIMVFWLTIFFVCFGLFSESNATVITVMLVCALSISGAIFLVLEMEHPFQGIIKVSAAPLYKALENIGR